MGEGPTNATGQPGEGDRWLRSVVESPSEVVSVVDPTGYPAPTPPGGGPWTTIPTRSSARTCSTTSTPKVLPTSSERTRGPCRRKAWPETRPSTAFAGDPDRLNLDRPRLPYAGDPRLRFGRCASPEAPTPSSVPATKPRFATDQGVRRLWGRCPQLLDHLRPRLARREATVPHTPPTHRGG